MFGCTRSDYDNMDEKDFWSSVSEGSSNSNRSIFCQAVDVSTFSKKTVSSQNAQQITHPRYLNNFAILAKTKFVERADRALLFMLSSVTEVRCKLSGRCSKNVSIRKWGNHIDVLL